MGWMSGRGKPGSRVASLMARFQTQSDLSNDRPSREVVTRSKSYSTEELEDAKKPISSLKRSGKIHSIASKFTTDKEEAERLKNFAERQKQEEEQKAKEE